MRISGGQPEIQLLLFYFGLKWGTGFDVTTSTSTSTFIN